MTTNKVIAAVDGLRANMFEREQKEQWLRGLDGQVRREVFEPLGMALPEDDSLLIPEPYGLEIYTAYLEAAMDRENGEIARYNQSIGQFNAAYLRYVSDCIRSHLAPNPGSFRV